MSSSKQYGLQIPKKNTSSMVQKHSAFGDDSDSEKSDGGGTDWKKRALKGGEKITSKMPSKVVMQRALDEDSTVYQYDEVYDQMQKTKQDKTSKEKDKKPKYIEKLMAAAEKRKIENERRIERQVQKEREAEGDEFKDKETFVTSAYKKKLEEFAKLDAEQKRQDMLEEIGDVTKQQDLGGFYRHLYQTSVEGTKDKDDTTSKSEKKGDSKTPDKEVKVSAKVKSKDVSPVKVIKEEKDRVSPGKKVEVKKESRKYRKRKESESSVENKDGDTDVDSSSSSSSSESGEESAEEKSSQSETENPKRLLSKRSEDPKVEQTPSKPATPVPQPADQPPPQPPAAPRSPVPQINIWEKRTVGPLFDAALKRYLERKATRQAARS